MRIIALLIVLPLSAILFSAPALAADKDYGNKITDEITDKECGACHMTFPPVHLPTVSWQAIMAGLSDHFGEDASLDEATRRHIEAYLVSKSLDGGGTMWGKMQFRKFPKGKVLLRITDAPRWRKDHRSGKYKSMARAKNSSGANCVVCHKSAERGIYEEFERD